jgi:acid phosphatase
VLSGHDHDYERINAIGGVTYVVTGGGGYSVRRVGRSDVTAFSAPVFHFVRGEIRRDELHLEAVDPSGGVIDEVFIPRVVAPSLR